MTTKRFEDTPVTKDSAHMSLLERTNSWKPFIDEATSAVLAKDYRKKTVENILHIIDPSLSCHPGSLWRYVQGTIIGPGFLSGRKLLYEVPFRKFIQRKSTVFENAPLEAIKAFNAFVSFLFTPDIAQQFFISETLARRLRSQTEFILEKGKKSRDYLLSELLAESQTTPSKKSPAHVRTTREPIIKQTIERPPKPPQLFSEQSILDQEEQQHIRHVLSGPQFPPHEGSSPSDHTRSVIALLEHAVNKASLARQNVFISLSSPQVFLFKDLVDIIKNTPLIALDEPFLTTCFLETNADKISALLSEHTQATEQIYSSVLEKARKRTDSIRQVQDSVHHYQSLLRPLSERKNSKEQASLLLNQLSTIEFPESFFKAEANVDTLIHRKVELCTTVIHRVETEFRDLIIQQRTLIRSADFLNLLLYSARWEVVSGTSPYPDLAPILEKTREYLFKTITINREALSNGTMTLAEYSSGIIKVIYEQDVLFVRGELSARSFRLKDLRAAVLSQLISLDRSLSLHSLAGIQNEQLMADREWAAHFLFQLIDPYTVFQDTFDPESINILFRYWWLDFERFIKNRERRAAATLTMISPHASELIRPIARTLDIIETINGTTRQQLYQRFVDTTKTASPDHLASAIDQWLSNESSSITGIFLPSLAILSQAEQEPLIKQLLHIDMRIRDTTRFAKDLQAIKTFEPERIDSLLEVISLFPFVPSFDQSVAVRMQHQLSHIELSLTMLEQELIKELGLVDQKAPLQFGSAINNLIPQAILTAGPVLKKLAEEFHEFQLHTDLYVSSIAHFMADDITELSRIFEALSFEPEPALQAFQKLSQLLFCKELLKNALHPKNFASILLLPTAVAHIIRRLRQLEDQEAITKEGSLIDQLDTIAGGEWSTNFPQTVQRTELTKKLGAFVSLAKRVLATSGLVERREARLIEGIEKIVRELSDNAAFDIPQLAFIPGDLSYLWPVQQE